MPLVCWPGWLAAHAGEVAHARRTAGHDGAGRGGAAGAVKAFRRSVGRRETRRGEARPAAHLATHPLTLSLTDPRHAPT